MSFNVYEVIAHLVPGYIIIFLFKKELGLDAKDLGSLGVLPLAYAIGFFVQTFASWTEGLMFKTWGGKPSTQLLKGKQMWKVKFASWERAKELLTEEAKAYKPNTSFSEEQLFEIAKRKVDSLKYERVISFNAVYALSRAMTIAFLISTVGTIYLGNLDLKLVLVLASLTIVSWYRSKQRGFYYAKEILSMYLVNTK